MYKFIMYACVIVMGVMGILMAVAPKVVAKKSFSENPSKLMIVRIMGAIIAIGCVVILIMFRNMPYLF
ncbi:MAG: hypothetical protein K2I22_12465 [Lachnospiraceae bacterium]|nr:hypothetical protein [Lachnospiraceae bacterium]